VLTGLIKRISPLSGAHATDAPRPDGSRIWLPSSGEADGAPNPAEGSA